MKSKEITPFISMDFGTEDYSVMAEIRSGIVVSVTGITIDHDKEQLVLKLKNTSDLGEKK